MEVTPRMRYRKTSAVKNSVISGEVLLKIFAEQSSPNKGAGIFKKLIYAAVVIKCIYWGAHFDWLFGENSIVYRKPFTFVNLFDLPYLVYAIQQKWLVIATIILMGMISVAGLLLTRSWVLTDLLLWISALNIHNVIYPALTGGDILLNQFLFFGSFMYLEPSRGGSVSRNIIHRLACLAVMIQVCLLYFYSGLAKLQDAEWTSGRAVGIITQIRHYSLDILIRHPMTSWLSFILTWTVLGYQLLFSVLVWVPRIKRPLIVSGLLLHMYIALVMGITGFGFMMLSAYVLFWPRRYGAARSHGQPVALSGREPA
jgi:hypothetical protein